VQEALTKISTNCFDNDKMKMKVGGLRLFSTLGGMTTFDIVKEQGSVPMGRSIAEASRFNLYEVCVGA